MSNPFPRRRTTFKQRTGAAVVAFVLIFLAVVFLGLALEAWIVMLAAGAFHSWWGWPTLSFWQAYLVAFVLTLLFGGNARRSS